MLYREALGGKFGKQPYVGIRLEVSHNDEVIYPGVNYDTITWYQEVPMEGNELICVKDNSTYEGYQWAHLHLRILMSREHSLPMAVLLKNESFRKNPIVVVKVEIRVSIPRISLLTPG